MKMLFVILIGLSFLTVNAQEKKAASPKKQTSVQQKPQDKKIILKTIRDKMSYVIGYDVGIKMVVDIQQKMLDLDSKVFMMAVNDAFEGKKPVLSDDEALNIMELFKQLMKATPEQRQKLQEQMFSGK